MGEAQNTIHEADFPHEGTTTQKLRFLLDYAVLAPSSHNTQPWLFKIRSQELELYADRARALPVVDPEDRELTISCGTALFHLRIAMRHFGYADKVEALPNPDDPDLLVQMSLGEGTQPTGEEDSLFHAIPKRRTNRMPFEDRKVSDQLQRAFRDGAEAEGAWLHIIEEENVKNQAADLIAEGDRVQAADKRFRRELAAWLHPNRSRSRDGMPGYAFGCGDLMSYAGPLVIRTFDWGKGQAAKDRQLAAGSPVLAVLGTEADSPAQWLKVGQALDRVLLTAAANGISASFLNQPIEVAELRPDLAALVARPGLPQVLLRMGYGPEARTTPRRPVNQVLM
jgi:nitroreductase